MSVDLGIFSVVDLCTTDGFDVLDFLRVFDAVQAPLGEPLGLYFSTVKCHIVLYCSPFHIMTAPTQGGNMSRLEQQQCNNKILKHMSQNFYTYFQTTEYSDSRKEHTNHTEMNAFLCLTGTVSPFALPLVHIEHPRYWRGVKPRGACWSGRSRESCETHLKVSSVGTPLPGMTNQIYRGLTSFCLYFVTIKSQP